MSAEIPRINRETAVRGTVIATVFLAASSAGVLAAREVSRRRAERQRIFQEGNNNSGDFGIIPKEG
nr:hypothetical protein [Candidatus Levybacteria bacterium]